MVFRQTGVTGQPYYFRILARSIFCIFAIMRKLKIYIDTSVIGGYFDPEFADESKRLFIKFQGHDFELVISDLTQSELIRAPQNVKDLINNLNLQPEIVSISPEVIALAQEYIKENVVGQASLDDC